MTISVRWRPGTTPTTSTRFPAPAEKWKASETFSRPTSSSRNRPSSTPTTSAGQSSSTSPSRLVYLCSSSWARWAEIQSNGYGYFFSWDNACTKLVLFFKSFKKRPHYFATLPLSSFSLLKNCLHIVLRFNLYLKWEHFLIIYRLFLSVMGKTIIRLSFLFWPFSIE